LLVAIGGAFAMTLAGGFTLGAELAAVGADAAAGGGGRSGGTTPASAGVDATAGGGGRAVLAGGGGRSGGTTPASTGVGGSRSRIVTSGGDVVAGAEDATGGAGPDPFA
jgi:hypothetical protein